MGGDTFRHFLIYSLIPVDISDPANLTEKSEKEPEVNEIAAPVVQTPVPEITADTILYYNPSGGEYYHLDQNCRRINERYLPLKGSFRYSELNDKANGFSRLKPCEICGAPVPAPAQKEDVVTEYDTGGL